METLFAEYVAIVRTALPDAGEIDYELRVKEIALEYWRGQYGVFGKLMLPREMMGVQSTPPPFVKYPGNPDTMSVKFKTARDRNRVKQNTTSEERADALLQYVRWKIGERK